jgi:hypothetical protein
MKKVSLGGREKENTHLFALGVLIITRYKALAIEQFADDAVCLSLTKNCRTLLDGTYFH